MHFLPFCLIMNICQIKTLYETPSFFYLISLYFFVNFRSTLCWKLKIFLPLCLITYTHSCSILCIKSYHFSASSSFIYFFKSTLHQKPNIFLLPCLTILMYTKSRLFIKTHYFLASFPLISLLISNPHFVQNQRFFFLVVL